MLLGEIIKQYRIEHNMSLQDFANLIGSSRSYIHMLERNINPSTNKPISPSIETLKSLATAMQMDLDFLLKQLNEEQPIYLDEEEYKNQFNKNNIKENTLINIPVLGRVPAGQPLLADENIEGYLPIDPAMYGIDKPDGFFFLRVQGESMNKLVSNGSYVLIRKQDYCEENDVIVAIVNGDGEVTLKRFKDLGNGFIALKPESTYNEFSDRIINTKDTTFKIIGKVIGDFKKW